MVVFMIPRAMATLRRLWRSLHRNIAARPKHSIARRGRALLP
jgi:hypothetical protein